MGQDEQRRLFDAAFAEFTKSKKIEDKVNFLESLVEVVSERGGITKTDLAASLGKGSSYFHSAFSNFRKGKIKNFSMIDRLTEHLVSLCQIEKVILQKQAFAHMRNLELPTEYDLKFSILVDWNEIRENKKALKKNKVRKSAVAVKDVNKAKYEVRNNSNGKAILVNMPREIERFLSKIIGELNIDVTIREEKQIEFTWGD